MSLRPTSFVKSILISNVLLVAFAAVSFGQAPAAPTYAEYPPDPTLLANKKSGQQKVGRILRGTQPFDDIGKKTLELYYVGIVFREFTIKENWGRQPELRSELLKELRSARNPDAFQYVVNMTFDKMKAFSQSIKLHPAVRYNAMLLVGELNATERGTRGPDGNAAAYPDPLPAALDTMVTEYRNPNQIDAVRVAALVGIDRHAKLDLTRPANRRIPDDKKKVIVDEMIALLNAAPPAGRTPAGHAWMQRRAIDILAAMGMVGVYSPASAALEKIVADQDAPISLRCTASEALARWAPNSKQNIDASTVSRNLGLIAVKACKDELDRIAALVKKEKDMKKLRELIKRANPTAMGQIGAMSSVGGTGESDGSSMSMMMMGGPGYGGGSPQEEDMGDAAEEMSSMYDGMMMGPGYGGGMPGGIGPEIPTDPRVIWSRRRLKYQLTCVKRGLDGMAVAGKASQHEPIIEQVTKAVEQALALTDPPKEKPDLDGLTESIQKGVRGLAFLTPEVSEVGSELPASALPPGAEPVLPAGAEPATSPSPAAAAAPSEATGIPLDDPTGPAAEGAILPDLPPGVE